MRALFLIPRNPPPRLKSKKWWAPPGKDVFTVYVSVLYNRLATLQNPDTFTLRYFMHRFPSVLLCAFCFMSDLSPGSYRDLNLRAQLSLSALLLTRTSVVHLLWQAQALLALAQTHWIAALDCTAETSQSSNALMNWLSFYICLQTEIAVLFYTPPLFHKISVWFAAVASESDGARQQMQLW